MLERHKKIRCMRCTNRGSYTRILFVRTWKLWKTLLNTYLAEISFGKVISLYPATLLKVNSNTDILLELWNVQSSYFMQGAKQRRKVLRKSFRAKSQSRNVRPAKEVCTINTYFLSLDFQKLSRVSKISKGKMLSRNHVFFFPSDSWDFFKWMAKYETCFGLKSSGNQQYTKRKISLKNRNLTNKKQLYLLLYNASIRTS